MGYQLETTALISKENYNAFRIRCIMLILENLQDTCLTFTSDVPIRSEFIISYNSAIF